MRIHIFIVFVTICFVALGCNDISKEPITSMGSNNSYVLELFEKAYRERECPDRSKIFAILYDSIVANYNNYQYGVVDSINKEFGIVGYTWFEWEIDKNAAFYPDKYFLSISILHDGSISTVYSPNVQKNNHFKNHQLLRYYNDTIYRKPYIEDSIPFIGLIRIKENVFALDLDIMGVDDRCFIDLFDSFYFCLNKILEFVYEQRDELALSYFNRNFNSLSFKRKEAIVRISPLKILVRDATYPIIPPPH